MRPADVSRRSLSIKVRQLFALVSLIKKDIEADDDEAVKKDREAAKKADENDVALSGKEKDIKLRFTGSFVCLQHGSASITCSLTKEMFIYLTVFILYNFSRRYLTISKFN